MGSIPAGCTNRNENCATRAQFFILHRPRAGIYLYTIRYQSYCCMSHFKLWAGIFVTAIVLVGAVIAWPYLDGILPAVLPARRDIARLIEEANIARGSITLENEAQFPLRLPPQATLGVYAGGMEKPRVMALAPDGWLLVSDTKAGAVYAVRDADGDGKAEDMHTAVEGLNKPHGIVFGYDPAHDNNSLYIAEEHRVARYKYDTKTHTAAFAEHIMDLPTGGRHYTRSLLFHPDEPSTLLVSVGSSCDVCYETDERRAAILAVNVETKQWRVFASGLRNAVYMAVHPVTGDIWATEMGRDHLGDNTPPDEINIIKEGNDYGWPICYGDNIHDTDFDDRQYVRDPCADKTPSYIDIQAHSAPLGLAFIPEEGWPEAMWHDLIVAYHGSWNRTVPTGYTIVRFQLGLNGAVEGRSDFISGWLEDSGNALGRPAGVMVQPGGVLYATDDKAGLVYRIAYGDTRLSGFEECVAAGNPVMESYPRQCRMHGTTYTEHVGNVPQPPNGSASPAKGGCIITGCSSQVCADEEVITTCELRPEYQCYGYGVCERQTDGECGWSETDALRECLKTIDRS